MDAQRLIFYGVLIGLYEDGVGNDVVARMTRVEETLNMPRSFIYACPACMPAFDALRVYAARPGFFGDKARANTHGPGLEASLRRRVLSEDEQVHREAIRELITRWVSARLERLNLTAQERAELRLNIQGLSEKGQALLEQYQGGGPLALAGAAEDLPPSAREYARGAAALYADWSSCPTCDGASEASRGMPLNLSAPPNDNL